MHKVRNNRKGVTLAEMLIVVAIIIALAAVSAVAVYRYQRGLKQLELDGIAKEIFVAAQNHLTMAESQGYLEKGGADAFGKESSLTEDAGKGIYYFVVGASSEDTGSASYASPDTAGAKKTVLSLMLPFASVDETVRLGGSYVIRYQKDPGIVLDVFYVEKNGRYPYETLGYTSRTEGSDYSLLMSDSGDGYHGSGNKGNRRNASSFNNAVLGWYGGEEAAALPTGKKLTQPKVKIHNEEKLWVEIEYSNFGDEYKETELELVVYGLDESGERKGEPKKISLISSNGTTQSGVTGGPFQIEVLSPTASDTKRLKVVLDDITSSVSHFSQLFDGVIEPGSDIEVYAVAKNNYSLTNSDRDHGLSDFSNSLFAYDGDGNDLTESIGYIRHLENLDGAISGFAPTNTVKAKQISERLSWSKFLTDIGTSDVQITKMTGGFATVVNHFCPVNANYNLDYDGQGNEIIDIKIDYTGNAGLFGALNSGDSVSNLRLLDFAVTGRTDAIVTSGAAGALAGLANSSSVSNVLSINSKEKDQKKNPTIKGEGNVSVGGLIGRLTGGTVEKSAAALVVSSTGGSAGGLIGSASGGTVSASYSGGHTEDGKGEYSSSAYNVTAASGEAGGLIGNAGSAEITITSCYSTCSASGATAGGLVGSASGSISITSCYATGLVSGTTAEGAFAGSLSGKTENCKYYMIVNKREKVANDPSKGYQYLSPVGSWAEGAVKDVSALDNDPSSFNRFAQVRAAGSSGASPIEAKPYDSVLTSYYGGMYDLQSVSRLGGSVFPSDFVSTHYGDWPSQETWVINTPGGSGASSSPDYSYELTLQSSSNMDKHDPSETYQYFNNFTLKLKNNTDQWVDSITVTLKYVGSGSFIAYSWDPSNIQVSVSGNDIVVTFNNNTNGFAAGAAGVEFKIRVESTSIDFTVN